MEVFIIEAATKKRLSWIRERYFSKFYETSHNGCFQDNGRKRRPMFHLCRNQVVGFYLQNV